MSVAICGPLRQGYHDTSRDSAYYYFNFSTFYKTFFTMFINQTTANFPDLMVLKWQGNEFMMGLLFCSYTFFMATIIMNVLVAIFYSNYKNCFCEFIPKLKNQNELVNIVNASTKECGRLSLVK